MLHKMTEVQFKKYLTARKDKTLPAFWVKLGDEVGFDPKSVTTIARKPLEFYDAVSL